MSSRWLYVILLVALLSVSLVKAEDAEEVSYDDSEDNGEETDVDSTDDSQEAALDRERRDFIQVCLYSRRYGLLSPLQGGVSGLAVAAICLPYRYPFRGIWLHVVLSVCIVIIIVVMVSC